MTRMCEFFRYVNVLDVRMCACMCVFVCVYMCICDHLLKYSVRLFVEVKVLFVSSKAYRNLQESACLFLFLQFGRDG